MRYIRRKDDPLQIKASGYVDSGGLGPFDPNLYEEVEGELPSGWQPEPLAKTPQEHIKEIFKRAIQERPDLMTAKTQKDLLKMADILERALGLGLKEAAREAIREPGIHPDLEPYRTEMLKTLL